MRLGFLNYSKAKKEFQILQGPVKYENHFLNFLYVYLKFVNLNEESYFEIYGIVMNILKNFEASWFPSTILWQIELFNALTEELINQVTEASEYRFPLGPNFKVVIASPLVEIVDLCIQILYSRKGCKTVA